MATMIETNDAAGASSERLRRAAANTEGPASAMAIVIVEAVATAEARASIRRGKAWKMHNEAWCEQAGK
eukprot:6189141-Pleurochrysis_carterae.AAC.1